ncbi:di-heme-cytochrome C peroxidase [Aquipseudomonas campi]|nr:di-heme-cytochrome C peroxidase [Pseudomonas campi]
MNMRLAKTLSPLSMVLVGLLGLSTAHAEPIMLDQGEHWASSERKDFYSRDQGSQIMPLNWIVALKQANGSPFMADSLDRYGYLANPDSKPPGLPVGFTVANGKSGQVIGMTCSACHTRQIEVDAKTYRVDGGPAIVDFQSFLSDLDKAVGKLLDEQASFTDFAHGVLGPQPTSAELAQLRSEVEAWYLPYHTLISRALPTDPWGPARLDAVSMIFNRLTGLDIGPPPTYMIPENIQPAVAPVRYPFLWNAPKQDKTQWPGFADNGNNILGLSRNVGEVYGVFAVFHPQKDKWSLLGIDYLANNSANFQGLDALEDLVKKIGPPKWPWALDQQLAASGKAIYQRPTADGGCADCHGIKPGTTRFFEQKTWATPVLDVGTDTRQYSILDFQVQTGVLQGAHIPLLTDPLKAKDSAFNVLGLAVVGSILQHYAPLLMDAEQDAQKAGLKSPFTPLTKDLQGAFRKPEVKADGPSYAYESRVMEGIWAAAPYLHNGSVPTLAELLKPAAQRVAAFQVGPAYDVVNVGLAVEQSKFGYTLQTTDCSARDSGNSRCGHEYGTQLPAAEKKALLEYLKSL